MGEAVPHLADQDITVAEDRPSHSTLRQIAAKIDPTKIQHWDTLDDLPQFWALLENPPVHSVVVRIAPVVAGKLLQYSNVKNRPFKVRYAGRISRELRSDQFGVTGDTIKFSKLGVLLDGQHRLDGCRVSKVPLTTHVVFGLEDAVFDVLDQGKKRTASDVLAMDGVSNYVMVAGAVRQVLMMDAGFRGDDMGHLSPRRVRELVTGQLAGIGDYANAAQQLNAAFKHPPSVMCAILYMIGRHSPAVAHDFAYQWVHGARVGRNENFDVLNGRLLHVHKQVGGKVNRRMLAAMVIQTFNHWHADVIANPRALTWRREWEFPRLAFDKTAFLRQRELDKVGDTSLPASMDRMLLVLGRNTNDDGNVKIAVSDLAKKASIPDRQVNYILEQMAQHGLVQCVRGSGREGPAVWRLRDKGIDHLKELAAR